MTGLLNHSYVPAEISATNAIALQDALTDAQQALKEDSKLLGLIEAWHTL